MRQLNVICLILIVITTRNLHNVNCCKTLRARRHQKEINALDGDEENKNAVLLPYDNAQTPDYDNRESENSKALLGLTKGLTLEASRKINKRSSPVFQNFPSLDDDDASNNAGNKTAPRTLIATIAGDNGNDNNNNNNNNTEDLPNNQKTKRNPPVEDPLAAKKLRRARDKKFTCLCEETHCRDKNCLRNQHAQMTRQKIMQEYIDDYTNDNSAEELDKPNAIQLSDGPKKFNIPFANNVNFDQRVIVDSKSGSHSKPAPNSLYPIYANPQVYHYPPYALAAQPGLIYTGAAPLQQNYAPAADYSQFPNPSPIPAHLIKLWKNGAHNLVPVDDSITKPSAKPSEYKPNYSSPVQNTNNKSPSMQGSSKVTTPRQIDNRLYHFLAGSNEDSMPAYGYSTDFPYDQRYSTEIVNSDEFLDFIPSPSTGTRDLQFGDPATTNYAPGYYAPKQAASNAPNAASNNQNMPQYDYSAGQSVSTAQPANYAANNKPTIANNGYKPQQNIHNPTIGNDLAIEVDRMITDNRNNAPTISVPNDSDLRVYNPSETPPAPSPVRQSYGQPAIQAPASYNIEPVGPSTTQQQSNNNAVQPATTLLDVNNGYASHHHNPQRASTLRNADGPVAVDNNANNDDLFRGLEKNILDNPAVSDTPQEEAQAVDERPSTINYDNNNNYRYFESAIVQNAVKKVLNNFVPGKAEDLLANYGTERSPELAQKNAESLSPDVASTHVLKNLLNVPEVENMIVDTTNNLINQVTGSPVSDTLIKNTLRNVMDEIPRATTSLPRNKQMRRMLILPRRMPRYDESTPSREVFEKIKSIVDKSELGEEAATHPLAQNLIVKAVKHSLDKEKGVADEAAIRRAFNQLVRSRTLTDNYNSDSDGRPRSSNYVEAGATYVTEDMGYKLTTTIPVNERRLQGGVWIETPKNLAENDPRRRPALEEKRRKELEKKLDKLQPYNVPNINDATQRGVDSSSYYTSVQSHNDDRKSDVSTRQTVVTNFYDGGLQQVTSNAQGILPTTYPQVNGYPAVTTTTTTLNYQNYADPSYTTQQQPNGNRLNLLVESTDKSTTNEPTYMGKLVPVNSIQGNNLDNSNLVWIGDGVKLPLTMRRMPDNSFVLTLADEVCQKFAHKKCPCCLPPTGQGIIARERRNDEQDYAGDAAKLLSNKIAGNYRVRRDSGELLTTSTLKTFSNAVGNDDFDDDNEDYNDSREKSSIGNKGAPYKYQRYANMDRIISGSTRALENMLQWVKNVVTEAHEDLLRRSAAK